MKKRGIEKIPYIGIEQADRKRGATYIAATMVKIVGNEKHLITEVYRNTKKDLAVPLVRIVLTRKDFGTYVVNEGKWKRGLIAGTCYTSRPPIWDPDGKIYDAGKESVLRSDEDLRRIHRFLGIKKASETWFYLINDRIDAIATKERIRRSRRIYDRRQQALKERVENTPELPEAEILEYADRMIFREKHRLYYKKGGNRVRVACSKCGGVTERYWKTTGMSYESQFRPMIEPHNGQLGTCPMCGANGTWKPQGRKTAYSEGKDYIYLGQRYNETGMVIRYIVVEKRYLLGLLETGMMANACEELSGVEIARAYFEKGKDPQIDYYKHNQCTGKDFWDDCDLPGMSSISIHDGHVMVETYENMRGTILQYSAMREYEAAEDHKINPMEYAERYLHTPQIEMLTKLGLIHVVESLIKCRYGIVANEHANRVDSFLGIRKEHVRQLIRHQGEESILKIMQAEHRMEQHWTDEQIENLAELKIYTKPGWSTVLEYMGIQEMLNLIKKYAGAEYGGCDRDIKRLRAVVQTYFDYIDMRQELGYDLRNSVYLKPRNLNAAHHKMVVEQNQKEAARRIQEVEAKYPLIAKHYRRLRRKFFYEDEDFCIRPARSAGEIVMEGRSLHHCVGGDSYLKKHNNDISTILFLRRQTELDVPYITVEIGTDDLKLLQWHGEYNKKTDEATVDRWLNIYLTKLRGGLIGGGDEAGEEAGQPLAMLA